MIRILTSLVAVLTVTSIQSQTSLSQLSMLMREDRIDQLFDLHIEEIFKHSLSKKGSTELYNGGFISFNNESLDAIFTKTPIFFFHKDFHKSYNDGNNSSTLFYSKNLLNNNANKLTKFSTFIHKYTDFQSSVCSTNQSISSIGSNVKHANKNLFFIEQSDFQIQNTLVSIKKIKNSTVYQLIQNGVSKVLRIRSPNFAYLA